jgi:hypothetical protein
MPNISKKKNYQGGHGHLGPAIVSSIAQDVEFSIMARLYPFILEELESTL